MLFYNEMYQFCSVSLKCVFKQRGRKFLPKFEFSAKVRKGLHVILQLQMKKKIKIALNQMRTVILTENEGANLLNNVK